MRRGNGAIRLALGCALFFASLTLVVWRQSRSLEELRTLETARSARAVLQAERSALQRDVLRLESRAYVSAAAAERLGLRVPAASDIVILAAPGATPPSATPGDAALADAATVGGTAMGGARLGWQREPVARVVH
jgi:cell division protein FtsL